MKAAESGVVYEFGAFRLDVGERLLQKDGHPVPLTPKAFDLLVYLAERPGRLVEKQALLSALWPDAVVEEANLAYNVSAVRKALGDGQDGEQVIQTVPTRGYRFVASVRERPERPTRERKPLGLVGPVVAALAVGALIGGLLGRRLGRSAEPPRQVVRFAMPVSTTLWNMGRPAISVDGSRIAYAARGPEGEQLYVRAMDNAEAVPLAGTGEGRQPFFRPDGQALGFITNEFLLKVDLTTGRVTKLAPVTPGARGAAWGPDNRIYFSPAPYAGLSVVSADGGQPQALTELAPDEVAHGWPELLPDGRHLLFSRWDSEIVDDAKIIVVSLEGRDRHVVVEGGFGARYVPTGHLLYARSDSLMAVAFDPRGLRTSGPPVKVMDGIAFSGDAGQAHFGVSPAGTFAYFPGAALGLRSQMVAIDGATGHRQPLEAPPGFYIDPVWSPDGRRLALAPDFAGHQDIWVTDRTRGTWTRLTVNPRSDNAPVWRPDDPNAILFSMGRGGARVADLFSVPADGSRAAELVYESAYPKWAASSSAAARLIAFTEVRPDTKADIWLLDLTAKPVARPFLQTQFWEGSPALSPDGTWLAYESDESGKPEIYVRAVSGAGGKWQVSTGGGDRPRWSPQGRQIVYRRGAALMVAGLATAPVLTVERPRLLLEGDFETGGHTTPNYAIAPDGRRVVMIEPARDPSPTPTRLVVTENWFDELRKRVPH